MAKLADKRGKEIQESHHHGWWFVLQVLTSFPNQPAMFTFQTPQAVTFYILSRVLVIISETDYSRFTQSWPTLEVFTLLIFKASPETS